MKCEHCPQRLNPDWKYCPCCGQEIIVNDDDRLSSRGAQYFPEAFEEAPYKFGRTVAEDSGFYQVFIRYILTVVADLSQLVHFRAHLIQAASRVAGTKHGLPPVQIQWCALSLATEKYFAEKAVAYDWTLAEEDEIKSRWYELMAPAFLPSIPDRKLDIKILRAWSESFLALHRRDTGPLPTCAPCTAKCQYQSEVLQITQKAKIKSDFYSYVNREDVSASDAAAEYSRLLTERLIGQSNVDLAYCLAIHLITGLEVPAPSMAVLSTDAQLVLAHKVHTTLGNLEASALKSQGAAPDLAPDGIRAQVLEVIVRQALVGAPWQKICAAPMQAMHITPEEVDRELKKRKAPDEHT